MTNNVSEFMVSFYHIKHRSDYFRCRTEGRGRLKINRNLFLNRCDFNVGNRTEILKDLKLGSMDAILNGSSTTETEFQVSNCAAGTLKRC